MAERAKKRQRKQRKDLDEILRRVDELPVVDDRQPDDIIGYDEIGAPTTEAHVHPSVPSQDSPAEPFDFGAWKKKVMDNPASRAVIEEFLEYRHREWELAIEKPQSRRAKGARKLARRPRP
jgi:hypothetical protein